VGAGTAPVGTAPGPAAAGTAMRDGV